MLVVLVPWLLTSYGSVLLLTEGSIFARPRSWLTRRSAFFAAMLGCPMCVGFWVGVVLSVVLDLGPLRSVSASETWYHRAMFAWCDGASVSFVATMVALLRARIGFGMRLEMARREAPAPTSPAVRRIA